MTYLAEFDDCEGCKFGTFAPQANIANDLVAGLLRKVNIHMKGLFTPQNRGNRSKREIPLATRGTPALE
jgi:hypothetical protein